MKFDKSHMGAFYYRCGKYLQALECSFQCLHGNSVSALLKAALTLPVVSLSVFFTETEIVRARSAGNLKDGAIIIPANICKLFC